MIHYTEYIKQPYTVTSDSLMCFDIEVSSYWIKDGIVYEYDATKTDIFYNECEKGSVVYIWQFSIDDTIYYGRDFKEFDDFLNCIIENSKGKLYCYVHNLSYEFCFCQNLSGTISNVFARQIRKPMKFIYNDVVEFRCSYQLTHLSLDSWGKQIGVHKKTGYLDYHKLRTPLTPLTDKELEYCEYDIKVMIAGLRKYIDTYGKISKIPLTQTGEVRAVVKNMYKHKKSYHNYVTRLLPKNVNEYKVYKSVFGGGDTHANILHVGVTYFNVASYDETSAYPSMMIRKKFPVTPFTKTLTREFDFDKYCYIFCLQLTDVKPVNTLSYLAKSRCSIVNGGVYDNGRIRSAKEIILYCTELDYIGIHNHYNFEEKIINVRRANKGYLDTDYIKYILSLFKDKTTLKGVKGYEDLYLQQKARLNSLYGLMVTDIIQPDIVYDGCWSVTPQYKRDYQTAINEIQDKKYKNNLSYCWGIYVTSWARFELWNMIDKITYNSDGVSDVIYYDTDSIKFLNFDKHNHLFIDQNKIVSRETIKALKYHGLPLDSFEPVAPNGKKSSLGYWDYEGEYEEFKTLGAKKYCYKEDGEIHITVSGVPKSASSCLQSLDDFNDGFIFPASVCHKGLATYIDGTNYSGILPDGYKVNQPYGLNIRDIGYTLGMTDEFTNIINYMRMRGDV